MLQHLYRLYAYVVYSLIYIYIHTYTYLHYAVSSFNFKDNCHVSHHPPSVFFCKMVGFWHPSLGCHPWFIMPLWQGCHPFNLQLNGWVGVDSNFTSLSLEPKWHRERENPTTTKTNTCPTVKSHRLVFYLHDNCHVSHHPPSVFFCKMVGFWHPSLGCHPWFIMPLWQGCHPFNLLALARPCIWRTEGNVVPSYSRTRTDLRRSAIHSEFSMT